MIQVRCACGHAVLMTAPPPGETVECPACPRPLPFTASGTVAGPSASAPPGPAMAHAPAPVKTPAAGGPPQPRLSLAGGICAIIASLIFLPAAGGGIDRICPANHAGVLKVVSVLLALIGLGLGGGACATRRGATWCCGVVQIVLAALLLLVVVAPTQGSPPTALIFPSAREEAERDREKGLSKSIDRFAAAFLQVPGAILSIVSAALCLSALGARPRWPPDG